MQVFELVVGRSQRLVNALDIVPALPPLNDFTPTPWGRWTPTNTTTNATFLVEVLQPHLFSKLTAAAGDSVSNSM